MIKIKNLASRRNKTVGGNQAKEQELGDKASELGRNGSTVGQLEEEASEVESALQRSFGTCTVDARKRGKASDGLWAVASHWTDGDAKRLVLALAQRYGAHYAIGKHDLKKPKALLVSSPKNSTCNSAKLGDLDWNKGWWTDDSFGMHYLHVHHKDGETVHRVYCRHCQQPRIQVTNGKLYWLFSN
jgi:hypothetical protein